MFFFGGSWKINFVSVMLYEFVSFLNVDGFCMFVQSVCFISWTFNSFQWSFDNALEWMGKSMR